jgi:hypothetical protein
VDAALPRREGTEYVGLTEADGPRYHAWRLSAATRLQDLVADYRFFTHGLLMTFGRWLRDPVPDYTRDHPECCVGALSLPSPLFAGMPPPWDRTLMVVPAAAWPGLQHFLFGLSAVNRDEKVFARMLPQLLPAADLLALDRRSSVWEKPETVQIVSLGVDGTEGQVFLQPAVQPPLDRIVVRHGPPDPETVLLGRAVLGEDEKPYRAVESSADLAYRDLVERTAKARQKLPPP